MKLTQQSKDNFRDGRDKRKSWAKRIDKVRREILAYNASPDRPNVVNNLTPKCAWKVLIPDRTLKGVVTSLHEEADTLGEYLRTYGQADLEVDFSVAVTLDTDKDFRSCTALASQLGIDPRELRRKAARIRRNSKGKYSWLPQQQK
jgi:hypothetical protein